MNNILFAQLYPISYICIMKAADKKDNDIRERYFSDKLDENKLVKLHTASELLDNKYGELGTDSRTAFHEKSIAWYYGEILRDRRKQLKITQQELAEKVGTARSYIARVEKGETDIQISSFFRIARALDIEFTPTFL